jgi:hypothetical protein
MYPPQLRCFYLMSIWTHQVLYLTLFPPWGENHPLYKIIPFCLSEAFQAPLWLFTPLICRSVLSAIEVQSPLAALCQPSVICLTSNNSQLLSFSFHLICQSWAFFGLWNSLHNSFLCSIPWDRTKFIQIWCRSPSRKPHKPLQLSLGSHFPQPLPPNPFPNPTRVSNPCFSYSSRPIRVDLRDIPFVDCQDWRVA